MKKKAFTLIEIIVVSGLIGFIILALVAFSIFFIRQVNISTERYNAWSQINYSLDDMRIRCVGAIEIITPITASGGNITISDTTFFTFQGEKDIYHITPDETDDNAIYTYKILPSDDPDNPGSLALEITITDNTVVPAVTTSTREILIDGRYSPSMHLEHREIGVDSLGNIIYDEPNFITANITANQVLGSLDVSREEGISFWFIDVIQ
ncbi:MAG: type II secretion system GspH family protein [Candidatus Omnitrophica bacterium]|nr:type II secretion system GspH family protein [Candidatus Omnitrophota bacterium]MBU2044686.1 type II secretion system GspH family protein [Candidatus Omnitrophota bacterium]MBU2251119.1 type II secretion system GspH family protein [Candidatus Omnitrophota bacterium]MBU2265424.1 type II secretion system GspH family protein [Candidatus Omnitrophota bacterium]MBU2474248.1 type II secretion system GspH family protein [Candidatus Omnitrophota bacterium]